MQQHPIPQNVMTVEFQLVGNLTLRQFAYLGAGGVLDFTLFVLPIYGFIKWPLIIMIAALFASLAYLPLNDIGLDRWIIAFFRAVNSPTKRIWHRGTKDLPVFARDYAKRFLHESSTPTHPTDRSRLNSYLATIRGPEGKSELDVAEESYISSLPFEAVGAPPLPPKPPELTAPVPTTPTIKPLQEANSLEEKRTVEEKITPAAPIIPTITTPSKPIITVHTPDKNIYVKKVTTTTVNRVLHSLSSLQGTIVMPVRGEKNFEPSQQLRDLLTPVAPTPSPAPPPAPPAASPPPSTPPPPIQPTPPPPAPHYIEELKMPPVIHESQPASSPTPIAPLNFDQQLALETKLAQEAEAARAQLAAKAPSPLPTPVFTAPSPTPNPEAAPPPTAVTPKEAPLPELHPAQPTPPPTQPKPTEKKELMEETRPTPHQPDKSPTQATPAVGKMAPLAATIPNVIIGLVRSLDGLLLTDVVIVVKDTEGEPVRALKSNKVGQFAITTPLPNGTYTIDASKDSYQFDTIEVTLNGQIFQPIEIRAK